MGDGVYLSGFANAFLQAREIEERRRGREAAEVGEIFRTERYLEDLDKERQAQEEQLPAILAQQQARRTGTALRGPAGPNLGAASLEVPPAALATGGMAAVRPPVTETLLGGLTPQAQARFLTSKTGRAVLPTLEASERERRLEEDRQEAEDFTQQASDFLALPTPNVAGAADRMAAAMRRLNRPQEAAQWMLHSAKARSDETERTRSEEDIKTFNAAVAADEASPSAASLKGVHDAIDRARSVLGKRVALARLEARLQHALSPDRDEDAFLREATRLMLGGQVQPQTATPEDLGAGGGARPKPMTAEEAWRQAAEKHPQGLAKMVSRQLIGGKKELPDEIWDILRWPKPIQTKDASLPRRAALIVQEEVKAERAQGKQVSPLDFTKRWNAKIIELEGAEARAKKSPDELAAEKDRAAILRMRREAMEKPESLEKKTLPELTLLIQRMSRDLEAITDAQERAEAEGYLKLLRQARDGKIRGTGERPVVPPQLPPASKHKGRMIEHPDRPGERFRSDGVRWQRVD